MKAKIIIGLSIFLISGATYAACPSSLTANEMTDCLNLEMESANAQKDMIKADAAGTVSPVTGTDVRTIQPAAGGTETITDDQTE